MPAPVILLVAVMFALGAAEAEACRVTLPLAISSAVLTKVSVVGQFETVTVAAVRVALVQVPMVQSA